MNACFYGFEVQTLKNNFLNGHLQVFFFFLIVKPKLILFYFIFLIYFFN